MIELSTAWDALVMALPSLLAWETASERFWLLAGSSPAAYFSIELLVEPVCVVNRRASRFAVERATGCIGVLTCVRAHASIVGVGVGIAV